MLYVIKFYTLFFILFSVQFFSDRFYKYFLFVAHFFLHDKLFTISMTTYTFSLFSCLFHFFKRTSNNTLYIFICIQSIIVFPICVCLCQNLWALMNKNKINLNCCKTTKSAIMPLAFIQFRICILKYSTECVCCVAVYIDWHRHIVKIQSALLQSKVSLLHCQSA